MTNAQTTYRALTDHELTGRKLALDEREGMACEVDRLTEKMKPMGGREEMLLKRYRRALQARPTNSGATHD